MAETGDKLKFVGQADSVYQTGEYVERNPTYHVEDSSWKATQILKMIEKHDLQPQSLCEVGCGAGEVLKQLQSSLPAGTEFFGYEISPQAFALCQARENERLHFYCSDLLANKTAHFVSARREQGKPQMDSDKRRFFRSKTCGERGLFLFGAIHCNLCASEP